MPLPRRASMPVAVIAFAVGVGVCGATWAVAGPTVKTDSDLLDPMPAGVTKLSDVGSCTTAPGSSGQMCWRTVTVASAQGETRAVLADRLARTYEGRGYQLTPQDLGEDRIWFGRDVDCGPALVISTNASTVGAGLGGMPMPDAGSTGGLTTDPGIVPGPSSPGAGVPRGARPGGMAPGPSASTIPGAGVTTTTVPDGATASTVPGETSVPTVPGETTVDTGEPAITMPTTPTNPLGPVVIQLTDAGVTPGC